MPEEFGDGVEIASCHECHRRIAVPRRMEGDVFGNMGALHPLCNCFFDGGSGWQGKDGLIGMPLGRRKPTEGILIEFIGDRLLCLLHDDGVAVVIASLLDIPPSDVADVAETEPCEAAEEEALLDCLIEAWGVDEPYDFVGM